MLSKIILLTALLFGICYPLFLLGNYRETVKSGFYRFNLGLANVVIALAVLSLWLMGADSALLVSSAAWLLVLMAVSAYLWQKDIDHRWLLLLPSLIGLVSLTQFNRLTFDNHPVESAMSALGGVILCASIFAMNLGHWYLNVKNLPIAHLRNFTNIFLALLGLRFIADSYFLATTTVLYSGNDISLFAFFQVLDGFFLVIAVFFGTLLPLVIVFLVIETLKIKSTQSATGLLYVVVISVLIGEMTYKYYLVQYGIAL